jgi:hypothetical protein
MAVLTEEQVRERARLLLPEILSALTVPDQEARA